MITTEWYALQIVLSLLIIIVSTCLLHLLAEKQFDRSSQTDSNDQRWLRLGVSLSFAHIISGSCMFSTATITLLVRHYGGLLLEMEMIDAHSYTLSIICVMLHTICIMINDFKLTLQDSALPEENNFYIALIWVATSLCFTLFLFLRRNHDMLKILSIVALLVDIMLIVAYLEIIRRSYIALQRVREFGYEFAGPCPVSGRSKHFLILGVLIAASLVLFSVPLAFERLIWRQNKAVSLMCVCLNAISQALICITRLSIK